ncbi:MULTISPECIES: type II toxin-antitoxin system death-on-curing family toxin [Clostridium]|uniref:Type II toxin-antitoxin system death-on-curing family toxin n=1 Tax=Clostridium frigoriphilum TaxID=443253 RepID=A0ABU7URE6_9CLOT|nr:type II toxin-antitoxin system death-on-curing family toxin [Clostridium sp. DSM 17811]MBU3100835.1 type II toxin-antitoxin system death-on-curing family toxin [Clostridium sp. DSM 17811]
MLILLEYNEIILSFTQNELIDLGLGIAKGEIKQKNIYEWIKKHKTTKKEGTIIYTMYPLHPF